jgi:hypothetical protein
MLRAPGSARGVPARLPHVVTAAGSWPGVSSGVAATGRPAAPGRACHAASVGEVAVADLQRLPADLVEVLAGIGDDDQQGGRVGDSQPSQVANASRSGWPSPGCDRRVGGHRAHVDDLAAIVLQRADLGRVSGASEGADARMAGPRRFCSGSRRNGRGEVPSAPAAL